VPVVALRPMRVASAIAESPGACETCVTGKEVGRGKPRQRAAYDGRELCAEHRADAGQAGAIVSWRASLLLAQVRVGAREGGPVRLGLSAPAI
jgi:hypothetical protein